jgi:hypothetical protein
MRKLASFLGLVADQFSGSLARELMYLIAGQMEDAAMADDKTNPRPADACMNSGGDYELQYWSKRFNVGMNELKAAVVNDRLWKERWPTDWVSTLPRGARAWLVSAWIPKRPRPT